MKFWSPLRELRQGTITERNVSVAEGMTWVLTLALAFLCLRFAFLEYHAAETVRDSARRTNPTIPASLSADPGAWLLDETGTVTPEIYVQLQRIREQIAAEFNMQVAFHVHKSLTRYTYANFFKHEDGLLITLALSQNRVVLYPRAGAGYAYIFTADNIKYLETFNSTTETSVLASLAHFRRGIQCLFQERVIDTQQAPHLFALSLLWTLMAFISYVALPFVIYSYYGLPLSAEKRRELTARKKVRQ